MNHSTVSTSTVVDPVCGMSIDPEAAGSSQFAQTTYHFCAASCKTAFDANPTQYVPAAEPDAMSGATSGHACCSA